MCHVARAGYRMFDFGRSREGTGAYNFKRHWGFEPVPLPYQYVLADGSQHAEPQSRRIRRCTWRCEAWKRLPLPLTKVVGPRLTKYLP